MTEIAQTPDLRCRICKKLLPEEWDHRERALAWMASGDGPPPYAVCDTCEQAKREAKAKAKREAGAQRQAQLDQWAKEELQHLQANLSNVLLKLGVPLVLADARLERCPDAPRALVEPITAWAAKPNGFLVLSGQTGAGKSYLAAAVLVRLLTTGRLRASDCLWVSEARWLESVRNEYGTIEVDQAPFDRRFIVYDDLGAGYANDLRRAMVEKLIRDRHDRMRPTIITSNFSIEQIARELGERVASVLHASGHEYRFPSRDLRDSGSIKPAVTDFREAERVGDRA